MSGSHYAALASLQRAGRCREDHLTVKYDIIVLEVLPLLVPLGVLVENDAHCFSVQQNTHTRKKDKWWKAFCTPKEKKRRNLLQPHSLIGFKHSGVAIGSFGGELAAFPQLGRSSVRTSVTHIYFLLHGLHTLQTWIQSQCNLARTRHQLKWHHLILAGTLLEKLN